MKTSNPIMESYRKDPRPRKIMLFNSEMLDVYNDNKVFVDGDKLVLELEFDHRTMNDDDLKDFLETTLYYDYQDNKE
jgi:hypothetical protein